MARIYRSRIKHGYSRTPEYKAWSALRRLRRLELCPRWRESFENFFDDVGPKPSADYRLTRIDPNKLYGPDNVVWRLGWSTKPHTPSPAAYKRMKQDLYNAGFRS